MSQTAINKLKIVEINGADKLTNELELLAGTGKTPIIISEAGLGKQGY